MKALKSVRILLLFVLAAGAINLPFATHFLRSRTDDKGTMIANVNGAQAAARGWPTSTPHATAWPPPRQWSENRAFAYRQIQVWADGPHQMEYQLIGWPLPVYEQVQMWWPWNDVTRQTDAQPDPALRLYWPGVLLNPIIIGGAAWLVLVAPFFAMRSIRTRVRRRHGRCPRCGYDLRGDFAGGCPECGWGRVLKR